MSSTPKRSDSNCSFTKGADQISVRRISEECKDVEGRKSGVETTRSETTSAPSGDGGDIAVHDSCVLRHFSKYKSSHLRFLAWVAYTRKYADESMTLDESRTCPLLWCRMTFDDQDAMLKHVWNCPHLSKGLYWCYHCQKHERLGKFHKRCQGGTSKTDKIATVAKRIFSKLGAGHHKRSSQCPDFPGSNGSDNWDSKDLKSGQDGNQSFDDPPSWDYPHIQELPDTSVLSEMAGDWTAACQELPDSSILEMMGTECFTEIGSGMDAFQDNYYAETFEESSTSTTVPRNKTILPRLDTSISSPMVPIQWPSSQDVSPTSWQGGNSLSSSDIVSPMSPMGSFNPETYPIEISPTDTVASGHSFFSDSGYTSATSRSAFNTSTSSFARIPSITENKRTKRPWDTANLGISEEHNFVIPDMVVSQPMVFPVAIIPDFELAFTESSFSTPSVSRSSSNASGKSREKDASPHWSDATTLVQSFEEVVNEHLEHTNCTLRSMPFSPIGSELLNVSKASLVSTGLNTLAGVLEGRYPTSILQVFAFTHIACACAIVMDHGSEQIQMLDWFQDTLSWISEIQTGRQKELYTQIATAIWRPLQSSENDVLVPCTPPASKTNKLLLACQHFLDILQHLTNQENASLSMLPPSQPNHDQIFNFAQLSFEFKAKSRVIDKLITMNTIEAFIADVVEVEKRLQQGSMTSIRQLELDLIFLGKQSSQSHTAYTRFLSHVTTLTNELYNEESSSRNKHQLYAITILKRHLSPSQDTETQLAFGESVRVEEEVSSEFDVRFDGDDSMDFGFDFDAATAVVVKEGASMEFTPPTPFHSSTPTPQPDSNPLQNPTNPNPKSTNSTCPHCPYAPTGEEKWKASNLRRHKRTQHPTTMDNGGVGKKLYRCRWQGCKSVFTRSDNLRSHRRDKGHGAGFGEVVEGVGCA